MLTALTFYALSVLGPYIGAAETENSPWSCHQEKAQPHLESGFAAQRKGDVALAMSEYKKCLEIDSGCTGCMYELGWSFWKQGDWASCVEQWESVQESESAPDEMRSNIEQFLPTARSRVAKATKGDEVLRPNIGITSQPPESPVQLKLAARFQGWNNKPTDAADIFDIEVHSPKSIAFHPKLPKVYVQALEAEKTLVFDSVTRQKIATIKHKFVADDKKLLRPKLPPGKYTFDPSIADPKVFSGKPVEAAFTHRGRYLWVPYYRRDFDERSTMPSAMAIIDTRKDKIVRVMPTGPISKYVTSHAKRHIVAVSNWGDNTIHLIDASSKTAGGFKFLSRIVVEKALDLKKVSVNRDHDCGFCLRGIAFSTSGRYLFVTRMSGGGIAAYDLQHPSKPKYLGSFFGVRPSPRDILVTGDGKWLLISCNSTGYVTKLRMRDVLKALRHNPPIGPEHSQPKVRRILLEKDKMEFTDVRVGVGARTMRLHGHYLFVAVNLENKVAVLDIRTMQVVAKIDADSFPVGLDVSPKGDQVWTTSQGRDGVGGNSVDVFEVNYLPVKSNG